ncbi:structural maintenance of chromosomes protein 5 [Maniola jurtina]|uniref:structural maintenance of chromosomes protein 5 n=1 Tax=Maniola jurtina TaxID=191418 RepID=UPI001E68BBD7|nr:structural maintenance of chromosomes protein 5 [Maniola jurtina]
MSEVINPGGIRAGCIYRISLQNFVTFKQVTLFPGKSLNLIIGPNGTGKSTFLNAIILGLGGSLGAIGRADKLAAYVKTGSSESRIDIELYQKPMQKNVIITMIINKKNSTTWYINNNTVDKKRVLELIASLHIQVENLCQFLPQDKVHDFAQKNPQERLRDTLATVGSPGSVEQLAQLKDLRAEQKDIGTRLQNNEKELHELERRNNTLKRDIEAMKQRKEMEKEVQICEVKKLWLEFLELREKIREYNQDYKKQERRKNNIDKIMAPLQNELENSKREVNTFEQRWQAVNSQIHNLKEQVTETINSVRNQVCELEHIESAFTKKMQRYKNRKKELIEEKSKLDKLNMDKAAFEESLGNKNDLQQDLNTTLKSISKTSAACNHLKSLKHEAQHEIDNNIMPRMRQYQNKIRNLEDVNEKRLRALENYSQDTFNAVMWLRENRNMFEQAVHEPMMLQINFTDPKYARYLEATVSARDLIAFTFESTSDMNLFLRSVRAKDMRLVNAVQSKGAPEQSDDIRRLSYLGFQTYLVDTITAPDAILRYLCKQYKIHRIPIGNQHTYDNSDKVPQNITKFFTENHLFSIRVSAYSGAKSSSTREITPARLLANTIDLEQINSLKNELANLEDMESTKGSEIQKIDSKLSRLEDDLKKLCSTRKQIEEWLKKITSNSRDINLQIEKINDLSNECTFNIDAERAACKKKRKDCVIKQRKLHQELYGIVKGLQKKMMNKELYSVKLKISREAIVDKEAQLRERLMECREMEEILQRIQNVLHSASASAKQKQTEIKQCCNNKLPNEAGFPNKETFDSLPSDLQAIDEHCCELRTRMGLLGCEDEQIVKEYELREKQINKLKSQVQNSAQYRKELEDKLNKIKSQWLPKLEKLIQKINVNFADMFERLHCAGEVQLVKKGGEEDFDQYGIDILVKFRAEEQLSPLTRHQQSGGERALTTAVYLMALQALTSDVPFRCVDEINQGMDAVNERRMLEMLVEVTTQGEASQYFLLTPKLLPNLQYNENVTVHTIMNGKHIMNYNDWRYDKFLQNARRYRPA